MGGSGRVGGVNDCRGGITGYCRPIGAGKGASRPRTTGGLQSGEWRELAVGVY